MPVAANTPIDVIITCYKYGHLLARSIQSVQAQTYKNINIIVVDDSSPDSTEKVANRFPQVSYIRNSHNLGYIGSMEIGLNHSKSPLICFLDADDTLKPMFAETLLKALIKNPLAAYAYGQVQYAGDKTHVYKSYPYSSFKLIHAGNYISKTCLIKRLVFDQSGGFNKNMGPGQEDWDLWLSFIEKGFYGVYVPRPLFNYTIHKNSKNAGIISTAKARNNNLRLIRTNHPKLYGWRFWIIHPFYMAFWLIKNKFITV